MTMIGTKEAARRLGLTPGQVAPQRDMEWHRLHGGARRDVIVA